MAFIFFRNSIPVSDMNTRNVHSLNDSVSWDSLCIYMFTLCVVLLFNSKGLRWYSALPRTSASSPNSRWGLAFNLCWRKHFNNVLWKLWTNIPVMLLKRLLKVIWSLIASFIYTSFMELYISPGNVLVAFNQNVNICTFLNHFVMLLLF